MMMLVRTLLQADKGPLGLMMMLLMMMMMKAMMMMMMMFSLLWAEYHGFLPLLQLP